MCVYVNVCMHACLHAFVCVYTYVCVCVCVCVCEREREREREYVCACVRMHMHMHVCMFACMFVCGAFCRVVLEFGRIPLALIEWNTFTDERNTLPDEHVASVSECRLP
jgi:hypothetical protein